MKRTNEKWENFKGISLLVSGVLLLPFIFLLFYIPGKILDAIRLRKYRIRRETTIWQVPVSDEDFLRGCEIDPNSGQAETALCLRRCLADVSGRARKVEPEEIAPDMSCGELVYGWSPYMYLHDGFDSVGYEAVRKLGKGKIPGEAFDRLIQPEKNPRITMRELFRNYLEIIIPYLQNSSGMVFSCRPAGGDAETEAKI